MRTDRELQIHPSVSGRPSLRFITRIDRALFGLVINIILGLPMVAFHYYRRP